jgi:hypothetical protein
MTVPAPSPEAPKAGVTCVQGYSVKSGIVSGPQK